MFKIFFLKKKWIDFRKALQICHAIFKDLKTQCKFFKIRRRFYVTFSLLIFGILLDQTDC